MNKPNNVCAFLFTHLLIGKRAVGPLHNGLLHDHEKRRKSYIVRARMDLESVMLIEISQAEKNKYRMIYMWNLINKIN